MKTTEAQMRASIKYAKDNLKRIPFDLPKEEAEELKFFVKSHGMSMRQFILEAIHEKRDRMN